MRPAIRGTAAARSTAARASRNGVELMREHMKLSSRMHYVIADGGDVPNVVPEHAKVWIWARDKKRAEVEALSRASARSPKARR